MALYNINISLCGSKHLHTSYEASTRSVLDQPKTIIVASLPNIKVKLCFLMNNLSLPINFLYVVMIHDALQD